MQDPDFFQQIEQAKVPWGDRNLLVPVFYDDVTSISIQVLASLARVQQLLPSPRLHPLRITPWHCVINIAAFEYRNSDIGPYNEVSIGIPVVMDRPSPLFSGTLRPAPAVPQVYIRHLPVTTAIARDAGIEFAGYPKFIADIAFAREGQQVRCHLKDQDRSILTLTARAGPLSPTPRSRIHPITLRDGYLLRSELIMGQRHQLTVRGAKGVQLELGDHPIAEELTGLAVGQIVGYQYTPQHQASLTLPLESFAV
jgi:hypothetical protein